MVTVEVAVAQGAETNTSDARVDTKQRDASQASTKWHKNNEQQATLCFNFELKSSEHRFVTTNNLQMKS